MNCPKCDASLPDDAVLCVNCGLHLKSGRRLKTEKKRKKLGEWDYDRGGRPVGWRGTVAATVLIVLVIAGIVFTLVADVPHKNVLAGGVFLLAVPAVAGLVGTFTRVRLTRDAKGGAAIALTGYVLFLPVAKKVYALRRFKAVWVDYAAGMTQDQADTFYLTLGGEWHDHEPRVLIYRGTDEEKMQEFCDMLVDAGGLEIKRK